MTVAELIYTVLLKPRLLRKAANRLIRAALPRTVQYGDTTVVLNPADPVISGALAFRVYEKGEIAFCRRMLKPGMTVLDIGANVGLYSALASHATGDSGRVLAFEPEPESLRYLEATLRANNSVNVKVFPYAAAAQAGTARLYTSSTNCGDNRLYANDLSDGVIEVPTVRLDEFLPTLNVHRLDFIKIDVQGFEGQALGGLGEIIRASPSVVLMTEFWPEGLTRAGTAPEGFLQMLDSFGLTLHELDSRGKTTPIADKASLIARYPGRRYTNVVGFGPTYSAA